MCEGKCTIVVVGGLWKGESGSSMTFGCCDMLLLKVRLVTMVVVSGVCEVT